MELETLLVTIADGIARLTLNRPKRKNAFSPKMATELTAVLGALEADPDVRVLVLRGAEGNFCSGGDLQGDGDDSASGKDTDFLRDYYNPSIMALHHFPRPSIAVVEGVAAGAGVNLAIACDVAYAAEGARFAELFVHRSLSLDCGGSWLLPRGIGLQKAKELALFGEWIDARDAARLGLVVDVFTPDDLDQHVDERAAALAALPPLALAEIKRGLNEAFEFDLAQALDREASAAGRLAGTADFKEAMRAFFQKRDPKFTGR
jgi:2-(1,2-epoxy-1,2-dihydrophenyl)acetyl-CoA isomerase